MSSLRVAYLINQYPKVSHTFIRREILALERQGVVIDRMALRGWDDPTLVDAADLAEREKTRYVQQGGILGLLGEASRMAVSRPIRFFRAFSRALSMSRSAVRPLPYHLVYLAQACRIARWLETSGATHLHAHFGTNPAEIAHLVRCLGGPSYSFTIHGQDEIEGAKGLGFPAKIGESKFTVAISAYCRSQILREIPDTDWDKLKIVHCGLDAEYFSENIVDPPAAPLFLSIGRMSPEKGHLILLDAFSKLRLVHSGARLVLAGDGPMRAEIEDRIATLKLADAVEITGWVDAARIENELARTAFLVQPSFIEGLPVVIMEAMAKRRPVISTYVAGIPELVISGKTGWLVPAGETDALAEAMFEAASASPESLQLMGRLGQARARDRHLIDNEAKKLIALFAGANE